MDKNSLLTLEELIAWRNLDLWRRENKLKEMFPHQGFHATRPIVGCECCTCATKWYLTDKQRIESHNSKIIAPLKEQFMKEWVDKHESRSGAEWNWSQKTKDNQKTQLDQSLRRAQLIDETLVILRNKREEWHSLLLDMLRKNDNDILFVRKMIRLLLHLLNLENKRKELVKEVAKPYSREDWGLRQHVPYSIQLRKEWNGRFYM